MDPSPTDQLLEKIGRYLSNALTAFESLLSEIGTRLWAAVRRTGHFVLRTLRQGLKNLSYLLRLSSIFLALVWIGSGCFEFTYNGSWILKALGWAGTIFAGAVILSGVVISLWPGFSEKYSDQRTHTIQFIFVHIVALAFLYRGMHFHYEFRSPVLKWAKTSLVSVLLRIAPLAAPRELNGTQSYSTDGQGTPKQDSQSKRFKDWIPSVRSTSEKSPLLISVKCKGAGDNTWARANDHDTQLSMWVEKIRQTETNTILDVAVKTWFESTTGALQKAEGTYFVDDVGTKYSLEDDRGDYTFFDRTHICKGDEIYRFQLLFRKLTHQ